jgi:hypothetical protein
VEYWHHPVRVSVRPYTISLGGRTTSDQVQHSGKSAPFPRLRRRKTLLTVMPQKHKELFDFPTQPVVSHRCRDLIKSLIQDPEDRLSSRRYKLKDLAASSPSLASLPRAASSNAVPTTSTINPAHKRAPRDHAGRYVFPRDAEDIKSHKWFRGIP